MTSWNRSIAWDSDDQWGISEPANPENLSVETESEHEIHLEWDIIGVADQTNIYRAEESGNDASDYEHISSINTPENSYIDENLINGRTYYYRVSAENALGESETSNESSDITNLPKPEIGEFNTSEKREIEVNINLQDNNDDGDVTIYRDNEDIGVVDPSSSEYVDDSNIQDGEEYEYHLYRDTGQNSEEGPSSSTISYLPDIEGFMLDGTELEELGSEWDEVLNNGEYRLEIRDDDPDGDHPNYEHETTISYETTNYTIENMLDGEQYSVRIKTQTEYTESDWTTADEITKFPTPNEIEVVEYEDGAVTIEWNEYADNEVGSIIFRRSPDDDEDGFIEIGETGPNTTTFTDEEAITGAENEYYVREYTEWVYADTGTTNIITDLKIPEIDDANFNLIDKEILVEWTGDNNTSGHYEIYREDKATGVTRMLNKVELNEQYTDDTVIPGESYRYVLNRITNDREEDGGL